MRNKNINIFLPICREKRIQIMADQLAKLDIGGLHISLLVIIDNLNITKESAENIFKRLNLEHLKVLHTGKFGSSEFNVAMRRSRIRDVFELAALNIYPDCSLVFTLEDDTDFNSNSLKTLINDYELAQDNKINIGLVSGIQVGRWGYRMIGAWRVNPELNYENLYSIKYKEDKNIELVDATGFYCFVTSKELFCNTPFHYGQFGPDIYFGLDLTLRKYINLVDWTVTTGHNDGSMSLKPDKTCIQVFFEKRNYEWNHYILPDK